MAKVGDGTGYLLYHKQEFGNSRQEKVIGKMEVDMLINLLGANYQIIL